MEQIWHRACRKPTSVLNKFVSHEKQTQSKNGCHMINNCSTDNYQSTLKLKHLTKTQVITVYNYNFYF